MKTVRTTYHTSLATKTYKAIIFLQIHLNTLNDDIVIMMRKIAGFQDLTDKKLVIATNL